MSYCDIIVDTIKNNASNSYTNKFIGKMCFVTDLKLFYGSIKKVFSNDWHNRKL